MVKRNGVFNEIKKSYLFLEVDNRKKQFLSKNPTAKVISLGVGNTTEPLPHEVVGALKEKADMLGTESGYAGYGEYNGMPEIRKLISKLLYASKVSEDEIFISDGSKPDLARLQFLFGSDCTVAVQDPVYPVYVDSSVISGKAGKLDPTTGLHQHIVPLKCTPANDFFPDLDNTPRTDLIFFCSPNNPTGAVATRQQLKKLVDFAKKNKSIIIYDAAYGEYITDTELYPKSIFEIEGARQVAIETNSFSKTLGYTGVRLGWTVCSKELKFDDGSPVIDDWARIMGTFFNGSSNVAEWGALRALQRVADGQGNCLKQVSDFYRENARIIRENLVPSGFDFYGGTNSPYIWIKVPSGRSSWDVFDELLEKTHVVTTPGEGFGSEGKGFIRISAFAHRHDVIEAMGRIAAHFRKTNPVA